MARYCLDTSAYSHFKRGDRDAVTALDEAERVGVPAIVLGELRTGFALGNRRDENERMLLAFLRHPVVEILDVDEACSRIYAEIVVALRKSGTPVPTNDMWIAAVAARESLTVLTYDAHFQAIARVATRVLTTGSG